MDSTTISSETASLIATLLDYLKGSVEFVKEQAPDVIQQVLAWELAKAWVWVAICGAILMFAPMVVRYSWKRTNGDDGYIFGVVFGCFASIVSFGITLTSVMTIIKINVAPKVFLIEYLSNLVK